ncbi:MAG: hypothetical protein ACREL2_00125 [Gemmatimonadales bacterium]
MPDTLARLRASAADGHQIKWELDARGMALVPAAESRDSALSLKRRVTQPFTRTLATSVARPSRRVSDDTNSDLEQT